jgi:cytochrome c
MVGTAAIREVSGRDGALLVTDTHAQLGPDVKNEKMRFSGSTLNCTSCHLDSGTKQFGLTWMGVSQAYPQYQGREDQVQGLESSGRSRLALPPINFPSRPQGAEAG